MLNHTLESASRCGDALGADEGMPVDHERHHPSHIDELQMAGLITRNADANRLKMNMSHNED